MGACYPLHHALFFVTGNAVYEPCGTLSSLSTILLASEVFMRG